jgi:SPP1 gp7 family putative phage head morphogenesis protein
VTTMAGLASDGSPLAKLLQEAVGDAAAGVSRHLVVGTALGWNPRKTAQKATQQGLAMGLNRMLVIARTEQLKAYRFASQEQYKASGVVSGYKRLSARDGRVCAGCLAADGRLYKVAHAFDSHPACRCAAVPCVIGVEPPTWQGGEAWLREQDAETQTAILGRKGRELWTSGRVPFERFAKTVHDDTWGGAIVARPLGELAA